MGAWKHRLSEVNPESQTAICAHCGPVKLKAKPGRWRCLAAWQEQKADWQRRYSRRESGSRKARNWRAWGIDSIDLDGYENLLRRQGGVCVICGRAPSSDRCLAVDHDHVTGAVRGLLCHNCNLLLGHAEDDPARLRAAAGYLEKPR